MLQNLKSVVLFIVILGLLPLAAAAQDTGISGTIIDLESGEPLAGATVLVEELEQGATSDSEGEFEIPDLESGTFTLIVTFVGYQDFEQTIEISDGEMLAMEIELEADHLGLDELVVTGYGTQQRSEITGAISSVQGRDIQDRSIQTADQALHGSSAGFRMSATRGQPGAANHVRIRGIGSIDAGNAPLYIVDGVRLESSFRSVQGSHNIMQGINPNDIESIQVLRDAEATAIYGADGANGVVQITTRRGEAGETRFNVSTQMGVTEQPNTFELLEGPDFIDAVAEANANRAMDLGNDPDDARQSTFDQWGDPAQAETYDWQDEVLRNGSMQRYDMSAMGGTDNARVFASAGYLGQEGTAVGNDFERLQARLNVDYEATDRLTLELSSNFSRSQQDGMADHDGSPGGSNFVASPFHGAPTIPVTVPIYNEDGTFNQDPNQLAGVLGYNTRQVAEEEERHSTTRQYIGNALARYEVNDNIEFRSRWGLDYRNVSDYRFLNPAINRYNEFGGGVHEWRRNVTSWQTDQVLDYDYTIAEDHRFNGLFGFEYQSSHSNQLVARGEELPTLFHSTIDASATNATVGGTFTEYVSSGGFTQLRYTFDQRFHISGSMRYDGHSRFGEDRRWGLFYSGAFAWDLAQESFMDDVDWLNQLQPRISYGVTGNSNIGNYASRELWGDQGSYGGTGGIRPNQLANNLLTWEEAHTLDIALDYNMFEGRAYGMIGAFRANNQNLLLDVTLPNHSGYSDITDNIGTVRNEGIEAEIGAVLIDQGLFNWTSEFNITFERSEITELADGQDQVSNVIQLGKPRQIRYGATDAGINPANGRQMYYDQDGNLTYNPSSDDEGKIGSQLPDYYGGWMNNLSYGPINLEALFQFEYGSDIRNYHYHVFMKTPHRERTLHEDVLDAWEEPGDMTEVPRLYSEASFAGGPPNWNFSSSQLEDGSYIRLKNLTLGYELPPDLMTAIGLDTATIFVQGENLLTWTAFSGRDPEVIAQDQNYYPQSRTLTGGLSVNF